MHDVAPTIAEPLVINLDAQAPGRRAIAGFLLQILRSIQLGLEMNVSLSPGDQHVQMILHLEPSDGGDHKVLGGPRDIVEQVKMRTVRRKWSSGEVAATVFPDLLRAVHLKADQAFRFVTNNADGLAPLQTYIALRGRATGKPHRWGSGRYTTDEYEHLLARSAGLGHVTAELRHLLDRFEITILDRDLVQDEIDKALTPLLEPGDHASDKRLQLLGQLMVRATDGAKVSPADLLALISPRAHRLLAHIQSLPTLAAHHLAEDARLIGYVPERQARRSVPEVTADLAILSGESGQGKTWTLAQLAHEQIDRGELALVMSAPTGIDEIVAFINERIWQPAHHEPAPVTVMAKSLRDAFAGTDGTWLTVYIDDVQDRSFALRLARLRWHEHGVRIVMSAQPRIARAIESVRQDIQVIEIGNFRSADLLRFLTSHQRSTILETMPDDVFELLLKPIHAGVFVQLPKRDSWAGVSEYLLFSAYWQQASLIVREQPDHPGDGHCLKALAGQLATGQTFYPWRSAELRAAGLDDPALLRLEQVGLLRRMAPDRVAFAADRMLNWAVAESLVDTILSTELSAAEAEELFATLDTLQSRDGETVGYRLGYVYFDALWLLAREHEPAFVAQLIREHMARSPPDERGEEQWTNGFGSLGPQILPALELLAAQPGTDEHNVEISRNLPFALSAIAADDPKPVGDLIARQVASGVEAQVEIGLRAARLVPAPAALDAIWSVHLGRISAHAQAAARSDAELRAEASFHLELSSDALTKCIAADPQWLARRLAVETDAIALDALLWKLKDERTVDAETAVAIWASHRERLIGIMPSSSIALIEAIGHFREASLGTLLDEAASVPGEWMPPRILRSRARVDPQGAIRQLAQGSDLYGWRGSNWWFDELAAADPRGLADAIRTRANRSEHPLTELVFYYHDRPEAMDSDTLREVIEGLASDLRAFNGAGDPYREEGRLYHPLEFLVRLSEPWQFGELRRHAGAALETELVRFAVRRRGRMSMARDLTGGYCERILAMIGGEGFDELVLAEIGRPDPFGRQDGYLAARWSDAATVSASLPLTPPEANAQAGDQVLRMAALAVHRCDAELESMLRAGAPVYVDAIETRSSGTRDTSALRSRVGNLLAAGDPVSVDIAAALAAFVGKAGDASPLVFTFLEPATPGRTRLKILATFHAMRFYTPELLPLAREMIAGHIHQEAQAVAFYLAEVGDGDARRVVIDWLATQDIGTASTSRRSYLAALVKYPEGEAAVVGYLQRSRANGHLVIEGNFLRLLAEAGESQAQQELLRACYRHSGFDRENAIAAIDHLRRTEPQEAYFAAQRLLRRHNVATAADLMLEIDPARAGPDLVDRYSEARPSLRLGLERRLRVRLGGNQLATLLDPLSRSQRARERILAAQIAAVIPSTVVVPWLETLAGSDSPAVCDAARAALRQRRLEAAALSHRDLMLESDKPLQWARMMRIMEMVDPYYLWARNDPASLKDLLELLPYEFVAEARQLRTRLLRDRENAAAHADRNR
ncbi:hypothetical protein [Mesorhizobium dulcispinae]|uniref:hypothetical protein n=1 Tax=Mesorhizobium dulcispinae TaxID=3072316 RepID=UPI002A247C4C|nr:hypothetical protein [Mesorhizobium sp. VK23D]MDX8522077.1 hypothetical protein [Mesorhizobium sp. VK23D]